MIAKDRNSVNRHRQKIREKKEERDQKRIKQYLFETREKKSSAEEIIQATRNLEAYLDSCLELDSDSLVAKEEKTSPASVRESKEVELVEKISEKIKVEKTVKVVSLFDPNKISELSVCFICLVQILYSYEFLKEFQGKTKKKFKWKKPFLKECQLATFKSLDDKKYLDFKLIFSYLHSLLEQKENIDKIFIPLLQNWDWERISPMKKNILRVAGFMISHQHASSKYIVNEAVSVAKWFGEEKDYQFVNAILQKAYLI